MSSPKTVLITGCSDGGIGPALAKEFQSRGCHVFATARNPAKMESLRDVPNVTLLPLDVSSPESISAAVAAISAQTGGTLDYLINNAGALYVTPVLDFDMQKAKALFDVNVWGVAAVTQAFSPLLISTKGCVVNISSLASIMYAPYYGIYAASKAALNSISETLRLELQPFDVRVVTVISGAVESKVFQNGPPLQLPENSFYTPAQKEIAERAAGKDTEKVTPVKVGDYARTLVGDILGGAHGKVYRGRSATLVSFLSGWMPTFLFDWISKLDTGLEKIEKPKQQ
ncbi:Short-chain dehydrogenase/reductase SDR [Lasiodiplodia theobromae]|uniref:Short-chain dehydrogenase/reductase SDR n=1 Tax=Lasiodiplodia theobromae TaxID=45133 RepID=UPI0015C36E17|nr:Short-chain dehydrogenase/reductase SDR [Lasiodiplodia theobromae]KAF4538166.1 Short-chain dehydrogenase/reductase SDR [Lasiodiplodia theobromae]